MIKSIFEIALSGFIIGFTAIAGMDAFKRLVRMFHRLKRKYSKAQEMTLSESNDPKEEEKSQTSEDKN